MIRALLVLLALATVAEANMAQRYFSGTRSGEPGGIKGIAIEHEELSFDLRPLAAHDAAQIRARYFVDNTSGADVTAPLVFVAGAAASSLIVTLDGTALRDGETRPLTREEMQALPAAWNPPMSTPGFDGDNIGYGTEDNASFTFTLAIPTGKHEIVVTYSARAALDRSGGGGDTYLWQLGYVLSPAKEWAKFGGLDVTVDVPAGWDVATSPKLARTGDTLRGKFPTLPGDTIGITTRAPTSFVHGVLQIAMPVLLLVVFVGGIVLLVIVGRRTRDRLTGARSTAFLAAVGWALAIATAGSLTAMRGDLLISGNQVASHGYGPGFGVVGAVLGAILAIPIGYLIARSSRRTTPANALA